MLRRFEKLKLPGLFEDFSWDSSTPEFKRINVVFGSNGSGKTSLALALNRARHDESAQEKLELIVEEADVCHNTAGQSDGIFKQLYVFDDEYIQRAHRFSDTSPSMEAVLTIGERTVEADQRLEELKSSVPELIAKRDASQVAVQTAKQKFRRALERVSTQVVEDLTTLGGKYQSRSNYSKATVERAFDGARNEWQVLSERELSDRRKQVLSKREDGIKPADLALHARAELSSDAAELLSITPTTVMLESLAAHPEATKWVQTGRQFHHDVDQCIYCGSLLTDERKARIDQHFTGEVAAAEDRIRTLLNELRELNRLIDECLQSIPPKSAFYEDIRSRYDGAFEPYNDRCKRLKEWVTVLIERLEFKCSNVLAVETDPTVSEAPIVDHTSATGLIMEHNQRVEQHDQTVASVAKQIEYHHLKSAETDFESGTEEIKTSSEVQNSAAESLRTVQQEIDSLENVEGDPTPSVEVLNREVASLLGRKELTFATTNGRYTVHRHGQPAVGLSEGERTAITLVHFMESVARHDAATGKPIVVIDDPVSSLDSDIFMGISTYIWTECVSKGHVAQLFLLTHNFELFRQWDIQLEALHKGAGMKQEYPACIYELAPRHVKDREENSVRRTKIVAWPPTLGVRKKLRSSYHHAFLAVVEAKEKIDSDDTLEHRLDAQLLFPNVIRRLLESFLGFKRPEWVGDFTTAMRNSTALLEASAYEGDSDALRQRLTRYTHTHSHSENPDVTSTVSPDEIGPAISSVFTFMNQLDAAHFEGLCEVAGKSAESLLMMDE